MTGLQNAYPGEEMSLWQRELILHKPSLLVVSDLVGSEQGAEIRSRIHPGGDYKLHDGYYTLETRGKQVAVVPFSEQEVIIEGGRDGSITVNEDVDFEWIPHVDCVLKSAAKSTLCGYIIFPLEAGADAREVMQSMDLNRDGDGEISLTFTLAQESYNMILKGAANN
jgi:hypothetical protein